MELNDDIVRWQEIAREKFDKELSRESLITCMGNIATKFVIPLETARDRLDEFFEEVNTSDAPCATIGQFANFDSSCYMDAALIALLTPPRVHTFVKRRMLSGVTTASSKECEQLSLSLRQLYEKLSQGKRVECRDFRKLIGRCSSRGYENFSGRKEQDASEFLKYLFSLFDVNTATTFTRTYATKVLDAEFPEELELFTITSEYTSDDASPMFDIPTYMLKRDAEQRSEPRLSAEQRLSALSAEPKLSTLLYVVDDSDKLDEPLIFKGDPYVRRVTISYPVAYDYLVVNIARKIPGGMFVKNSVIPDFAMKLGNQKTITLRAIVMWKSSHYTAAIRCGSKWYEFDDLERRTKLIGGYDELLAFRGGIVRSNGVLYFYAI